MSIGYAWEKLFKAVIGMAQSPSSLRERITDAYVSNVMRINPDEDLPSDLRQRFRAIQAEFNTTEAVGDEGTAAASTRAMNPEKVEEIARGIVSLYDEVGAIYRSEEEVRVVPTVAVPRP